MTTTMAYHRKAPLFSVLLLLALFVAPATKAQEHPRNVILMIADGFGPASATLARDYAGRPLTLDAILVGTLRTYATNARVTDSAAGATAFASGIKTYNGAVGMDTLRRPVGTILEAAEARGMATGLVSTARITHATPAAFSSHVPERDLEAEIAAQQIDKGVDVIFGGGRQFFLPITEGGVRQDERNLLDALRERGYQVVSDFNGTLRAPVVGLFTMNHMAYEVDRDLDSEPSLVEMTRKAIEVLKEDPDGFFLMVEGGRIDHAGHANDPVGHVHDILAYDEAVSAALEFARQDGKTLVVSVADHETGGLSLGRNVDERAYYDWKPEVLARVTASTALMADAVSDGQYAPSVLARYAGIDTLSIVEQELLARADSTGRFMTETLGEIISRRALLGWTTYGHTAVDVTTYAFGPGVEHFIGHLDNTAVGQIIADLMRFDLDAVTRRLRAEEDP